MQAKKRLSERSTKEDPNSLESSIAKLASSGRLAREGRKDVRAQKKLGIAVTFKRGNQVIKQYPSGKEKILAELSEPDYKLPEGVRILDRK